MSGLLLTIGWRSNNLKINQKTTRKAQIKLESILTVGSHDQALLGHRIMPKRSLNQIKINIGHPIVIEKALGHWMVHKEPASSQKPS